MPETSKISPWKCRGAGEGGKEGEVQSPTKPTGANERRVDRATGFNEVFVISMWRTYTEGVDLRGLAKPG